MSKGKGKSEYIPKKYESKGSHFVDKNGTKRKETFASIFESMLQSKAFKSLTKNQRLLYVYCKAQILGKRKPKEDYKKLELYQEEECFYLHLQAVIDYGLYKRGGASQFYDDMQALEDKGFIKKLASGQNSKSKNIYKLTGDWQEY